MLAAFYGQVLYTLDWPFFVVTKGGEIGIDHALVWILSYDQYLCGYGFKIVLFYFFAISAFDLVYTLSLCVCLNKLCVWNAYLCIDD